MPSDFDDSELPVKELPLENPTQADLDHATLVSLVDRIRSLENRVNTLESQAARRRATPDQLAAIREIEEQVRQLEIKVDVLAKQMQLNLEVPLPKPYGG